MTGHSYGMNADGFVECPYCKATMPPCRAKSIQGHFRSLERWVIKHSATCPQSPRRLKESDAR